MIDLPQYNRGEIGEINLGKDTVSVNQDFSMEFECSTSGDCCQRHQIPVLDWEVARISKFNHSGFLSDLPPVETPEGKTYWMKRDKGKCIFLQDNLCSIHPYKPFSCRLYPFKILSHGKDMFQVIIPEQNTCPSVQKVPEHRASNEKYLKYVKQLLQEQKRTRGKEIQ